ncbi:MAG: HAMP domain-containing histidine kinase [Firmicutes bacterium]|nr:HAMP domain-containing histidine kinase [Bacillota bacterium]HHX10086.1 HAMP domain-containing histidine kinase [Bacillota bacterium]
MSEDHRLRRNKKILGVRWHLGLSYLLVIWVILGVLLLFMSNLLETSIIGARRASLYAQAHLIASAIRARGGPREARIATIGGLPPQGRVLVLDGEGRVLDDSASDPGMALKKLGFDEVRAALSGREGANTYYLPDGSFAMYVAVPADWDGTGGAVFIAQDLKDIVSQYRSVMGMVVWGGGIASVVAVAFAWHLSTTISEPLSDLSRAARMMASGRLDSRVSPKGPLETRELGASFNYMAQAIENTMERQEQFLMAAAHELRAPLASMRALVESMEISPPEPDELPELINDIHIEILDLQQTAESILSLLRARSGTAPSKPQQANPAKIIKELIKSRAATISERNLEIIQRYQTGGEVPIDPLLFRLIVANLLDNAIKFTPPGGTVAVTLDFPENRNKMVLEVSDNGPGIPPEHLDKIFERFYRVDPARQKATGGAGLGLAIVKEACEKTAGVIHVETSPGAGTVFAVEWHNIRSDES